MTIQTELTSLYRPLMDRSEMCRICGGTEAAEKAMQGLSPPFFISTNSDYEESHPKVVIVGPETWGWILKGTYSTFLDSVTLDTAIKKYDCYLKNHNGTVFFQYFRRIRRGIFGDNSDTKPGTILWLNLFKFNHEPHTCRMTVSPHREAALAMQDNIFQREITLLKPNVVIFLTGPHYDEIIQRFYPAVKFEAIGDQPVTQLAQVVDDQLHALSFRTYHPGYMNRRKLKTDPLISTIIQKVRETFGKLE
jgi:hypothetical protein